MFCMHKSEKAILQPSGSRNGYLLLSVHASGVELVLGTLVFPDARALSLRSEGGEQGGGHGAAVLQAYGPAHWGEPQDGLSLAVRVASSARTWPRTSAVLLTVPIHPLLSLCPLASPFIMTVSIQKFSPGEGRKNPALFLHPCPAFTPTGVQWLFTSVSWNCFVFIHSFI